MKQTHWRIGRSLMRPLLLVACLVGTAHADTVRLKDNTVLQGTILSEDSSQVVIRVESSMGAVVAKRTISKADVAELDYWSPEKWLEALRQCEQQLRTQIQTCRETIARETKAEAAAQHKVDAYEAKMAKIHGDSGTLTQLQLDVKTAQSQVTNAKNQMDQFQQLLKGLQQRVAEVQAQIQEHKKKRKSGS